LQILRRIVQLLPGTRRRLLVRRHRNPGNCVGGTEGKIRRMRLSAVPRQLCGWEDSSNCMNTNPQWKLSPWQQLGVDMNCPLDAVYDAAAIGWTLKWESKD